MTSHTDHLKQVDSPSPLTPLKKPVRDFLKTQIQEVSGKPDASTREMHQSDCNPSDLIRSMVTEMKGQQHRSDTPPLDKPIGLPAQLKVGLEQLSGFPLDKVRVHYDSPKPASIGAFAYTQFPEIYLAPGQKHLLPHEGWHAAQQLQGRVKTTKTVEGIAINDERDLEHEATFMGVLAELIQTEPSSGFRTEHISRFPKEGDGSTQDTRPSNEVVQMYTLRGDFADPHSSSARALDTVIGAAPRSIAETLAYYDRDRNTTLYFATHTLGFPGETSCQAKIGRDWYDMEVLCNPASQNYSLGRQLAPETPIAIYIAIDPAEHHVAPDNLTAEATVLHEIAVHAIYYRPWVEKLRSGAYTGEEIRYEGEISTQPGGLNDCVDQHARFARGDNRSYNQMVRNVSQRLSSEERQRFNEEIRRDMQNHLPSSSSTTQ